MPLQRNTSLLFERDQLISSLSNANQVLNKVEQDPHFINVENSLRVATVNHKASEIRTHKTKKESYLADEDACCKTSGKCQESGDVLSGPYLQFVRVASRYLRCITVCWTRNPSKLCFFSSVRKWQWFWRNKIFFCQWRQYLTRYNARSVPLHFNCTHCQLLLSFVSVWVTFSGRNSCTEHNCWQIEQDFFYHGRTNCMYWCNFGL